MNAVAGLLLSAAVILAALSCLGFRPGDVAQMFGHPVTGGTRVGPAPAVESPETGTRTPPGLGMANGAVLAAYLAVVLAIGVLAGRRIRGTRGFFIADGRMPYIVVGISILGTYLSALTMMGLPGMAYGAHDWTYMVQLPFLVVTAAVITGWVLPRYRAAGQASIYALLEERMHVSVRLIASASFVVFAVGRMGLVLYLPALAFSTVTGVSLSACIIVMGAIITAYTVLGGMEAVVWTDALQVLVFIFGAALALACIFSDIGVERFLAVGMAHNKFRYIVPSLDVTRITTLWLILETLFQTVRIYGTQQDVVQRYLATGSTPKANRSVWIGILAYIPLGFFFYFIGTALFAFYSVHPEVDLPGRADPMLPHFVVNQLPAGAAGLVLAAIFAAAMSSIDSAMNSASTVCVEDFVKRFAKRKRSDVGYLALARVLTLVWGLLAVGMGLLFMRVEYAQIAWGKLMGISTNGILGLMALAFMKLRIRPAAAITGFTVSYLCLFGMMASNINFLLWPVAGNTVCFAVALAVNAGLPVRGRTLETDAR